MPSPMNIPRWEPLSIEAEQGVLGAILINNSSHELINGFLKAEHFFEPLHQHIYTVIEQLLAMGKVATPITLRAFIPEDLVREDMTVGQYIAHLAAEATTIINVRDYATNIRDLALHRRLVDVGEEMRRPIPRSISEFAGEVIDEVDTILSEHHVNADRAVTMMQAVSRAVGAAAEAYQNGTLIGMSYGLRDLDVKTLGLHAGDLVLLAGRPGMGKTAVALGIARNLGYAGLPGRIFSMEMADVPLAQRLIADDLYDTGPLNYSTMRSGKFTEQHFQRITEAAKRLSELPIEIEQSSSLSLSQIAAKSRRAHRTKGLRWLIIDYLQLIKPSGRYLGNQVQEIGEITAGLKALAKELAIPVILLSQLNRAVEARDDKRPQLADLRQSGNIEQDADLVLMLYREAYYVERAMPKNARPDSEEYASWAIRMERAMNALDIIVEKQRQGPIGTVRVHCNVGCNAVRDLAIDEHIPERRG